MADAPVLETPEVAALRALRLAIMCACLEANLLPWLLPGGRMYDGGGGLQLGVTIASHNNAVLFLTLADPPRQDLLFHPSSHFLEFYGSPRQSASTCPLPPKFLQGRCPFFLLEVRRGYPPCLRRAFISCWRVVFSPPNFCLSPRVRCS